MVELTFPWKMVLTAPKPLELRDRSQSTGLNRGSKEYDYAESKTIQVEAKKIRACTAGSMSISLEIPRRRNQNET